MKISLRKLAPAVLIIASISCTKEPLKTPQPKDVDANDKMLEKTAGHYIGERFGGGIIFFLGPNAIHGLIADTVDLPQTTWWNETYITTGATGTAIGTGPSNTRKIIAAQGRTVPYAALECAVSKRSGYTDWFLPSKDELNELYKRRVIVGRFFGHDYWSSSEDTYDRAWNQFFLNGFESNDHKSLPFCVRAIRAF